MEPWTKVHCSARNVGTSVPVFFAASTDLRSARNNISLKPTMAARLPSDFVRLLGETRIATEPSERWVRVHAPTAAKLPRYKARCSGMECRRAATKSDGIECRRAATKSALQSSSGIECRRAATKSAARGSVAAVVRTPLQRHGMSWDGVRRHRKPWDEVRGSGSQAADVSLPCRSSFSSAENTVSSV
jgi:hypothetical protein